MREIKFRAWSKRRNEFIIDYDTGDFSLVEFFGGKYRVVEKVLIDECVNGEHEQYDSYEFYQMEHCAVMEYTGLKDKNGIGQYMWEGDIVQAYGLGNGVVSRNSWGEWCLMFKGGLTPIQDLIMEQDLGEIKGNIFEAPELLKD